MNKFVEEIKEVLKKEVDLSTEEIEKIIEIPPEEKLGDYAFPCFLLAKSLKKPPDRIASDLSKKLKPKALIKEIYSIGPYVNFRVDSRKLAEFVLKEIFEKDKSYGRDETGKGKTIVIDFSSPNIAKPFGIGHLRTTVLGNSLYRIFEYLGYGCVSINHLGDWGTQFGKLIVAYKRWGDEKKLSSDPIITLFDLYVKFHQEAEKEPELEEEARSWFKKLEQGEKEAEGIWQRFKDYSLKEFEKVYRMLEISFDCYTGESFYNKYMDNTIEEIQKKGLAEISQDALVVDLEKYNLPVCLLRKKDEATLYATRDITAAIYRYNTYKFHKLLYVVGSAQKLHFQQVFKVLELMGYPWAKDLVHVDFGWIKFEKKIMSTRKGDVIFLEDVLNKSVELAKDIIKKKNPDLENKDKVAFDVGIGAVVFTDLSTKRQKDINFDWDEVLDFEGQTGPYVQYTHARLCSLLRKYQKPVKRKVDFSLFSLEEEHSIIKKLEDFPKKIKMSAETYEPAVLCSYLLDLSGVFNRFYQKQRIITDDENATDARILLVKSVKTVIELGLSLLGIKAPERM
ncbi:MAG: arginyl-tRNA synthetase [candidate division Zixibacteria bacterium SM23_73_2]|nr:MAG: arginyl-tRNA synthetase [candidate division Zixibacteria bacterium SM23_73_2]